MSDNCLFLYRNAIDWDWFDRSALIDPRKSSRNGLSLSREVGYGSGG